MNDPEQHFLPALVLVDTPGGPQMNPVPMCKEFSLHLWELGYRRQSELATKKFQRPYRGDQGTFNPAGKWVPLSTPDPEPVRIPDIKQLTEEENEAMLQQYRDAGMIPEAPPVDNFAEIVEIKR
ncbi:DUF2744 domain-containing protein [Rhodococcus hoagii]|uniref:DUF2744 domain-containing protein n=1 Tax=Rhodococcus hoagii TaxID=43767 RepID=A0A9Q5EVP4_RHOHA|nr:DUF2744 domain-containing protein [Prescottella equi]NKT77234.1 DUF2744 domain-containing protein [Prescottella equi]NKZ81018.1 DUF2744 domain-containing protein [Prescottella equi]